MEALVLLEATTLIKLPNVTSLKEAIGVSVQCMYFYIGVLLVSP
jgi:hypothetical protein